MSIKKYNKLVDKYQELEDKLKYSINVKKRNKYNVQMSRILRKLERF